MINRAAYITDFFSVSLPQASKDLSLYQEISLGNLEYERGEKCYFTSKTFKLCFSP